MKFPSGTQFGVYLALRNNSSQPILVNPTLYYMQGSGVTKAPLKTLTLAARQARHWTPDELSAELGLPKFSGTVNLTFSYLGAASDVILANGSIDQTKTYVFETKIEGVGKSLGKGLKDWDVSNGNDTMISLLNLDENEQDVRVTLFFDGGRYKLPVHLKAGGSTMFNLSDTIMMQQPDADGHRIPPGTLHGTAVLSAASADPEWINVGVSVGVFNVSTATCVGRCPNCSNYSSFQVLPYNSNSSTAPVGGTTTFVAWAFAQDNLWHNVTNLSSWDSDNHNVATSQGGGNLYGVGAGSFDALASVDLPYGNSDCIGSSTCPTLPWDESGSGTIVSAVISQRTSNQVQVSGDDSALSNYQAATGTTNLGNFTNISAFHGCGIGFETVGTISPSNYTGNVTIHRTIVNQGFYTNSTDSGGEKTNYDDTSPSGFRDDNPQSGGSAGKVYDLDAPGAHPPGINGNIYRYRTNFYTYATLPNNTLISPSPGYFFYVRLSCQWLGPGYVFINDVPGDNQIGIGTTKTTWNLQ